MIETSSRNQSHGAGLAAGQKRLHYAMMRLSRTLDARFEALRLGGRVAKWYSAIGHEATSVPAGLALEPDDVLCSLHRDLGAILSVYLDPVRTFPDLDLTGAGPGRPDNPDPELLLRRLAAQLLGRGEGFSEGIERSFHYGYFEPDAGLHHLGMISHLGSMIPVAAGCGFARRLQGTDRIAINFIGDGGTSTGDFHEGLNMAAVWKLPFILVIENNRYAFSTPTDQQFLVDRLSDRAIGYGIPGVCVDGNDPEAMAAVMATAVARARAGEGPTLVEALLGRMRGHAEGDDSLKVVPEEELEQYRAEDPVPQYAQRLLAEKVFTKQSIESLHTRVDALVEGALEHALDSPPPDPSAAHRSVFALSPSESSGSEPAPEVPGDEIVEATSYVDAISRALREELEADPTVVLMGQDIGIFEGAFRVTRGMWQRWPERVLDTPISESATLGIAAGAALMGLRPVVEMQFADFVSCGFNQITNVMAKFYYRMQRTCPVVVRLPSGGGVGAGAFHSQNPEGWFAHTAGLKVVCPATAYDAWALMRAAIQDPDPVIFCEHKFLYRRIKERLPAGQPQARIGHARVARAGTDLTLVGYGASTWTALDAAEVLASEGVEAEVIDLRTLVPLDEVTVLESVKKTGRSVVVHEAQLTGGFGGEIAARIADGAFAWLDAPVKRVAYPDSPVPYVKALERELLPDRDRVLAAAREVLAY